MEKLNQWEENKIIKKLILQKLQENQSGQWFYCVLHYSNWGDDGNLLEWDRRKWFYNENYIRENHRRIRRTLENILVGISFNTSLLKDTKEDKKSEGWSTHSEW